MVGVSLMSWTGGCWPATCNGKGQQAVAAGLGGAVLFELGQLQIFAVWWCCGVCLLVKCVASILCCYHQQCMTEMQVALR